MGRVGGLALHVVLALADKVVSLPPVTVSSPASSHTTWSRAALDSDKRQGLINQAQRNVLQQAIWQPLLTRRITFAANGACVGGVQQSPYGELLFHDADTRVGG